MSRTVARRTAPVTAPKFVRCAVYCRKSTEHGLDQEFNSLDNQRESVEAYIKSQAHEGWTLVESEYSDGGFTGANTDRPGLQRLLQDIEAGLVDCVVVYKIDRLSRSLRDFSKLMELFEQHGVAFVSTTQAFNTAIPMGRLMLHILASFSEFEREVIAERTRDKIAATRRKGKWTGGMPVLGYDLDANSKLVINAGEATQVRNIFALYLEHQSIIAVIEELDRRGWCNKRWTTRKGAQRGGQPFTKTSLHSLLTNVLYLGQVRYKTEVHPGEHAAIVDQETWNRVQTLLQRNGRSGGVESSNRVGNLLRGLLRCAACDCAMTPSCSTRRNKQYRYYTCSKAQKRGWKNCPSPSIPAAEIERVVIDQIRGIASSPEMVVATLAQVEQQAGEELATLRRERDQLARDLRCWDAEIRELVAHVGPGGDESDEVAQLAELQERSRVGQRRARELVAQIEAISRQQIDRHEVDAALGQFDNVWGVLTPHEQARVMELLVERVDYDGARGKVAVTFHADAIRQFGDEFTNQEEAA